MSCSHTSTQTSEPSSTVAIQWCSGHICTGGGPVSCVQSSEGDFQLVYRLACGPIVSELSMCSSVYGSANLDLLYVTALPPAHTPAMKSPLATAAAEYDAPRLPLSASSLHSAPASAKAGANLGSVSRRCPSGRTHSYVCTCYVSLPLCGSALSPVPRGIACETVPARTICCRISAPPLAAPFLPYLGAQCSGMLCHRQRTWPQFKG